ncbi:MAG TPA: hypothetical protein VJK08_02055 [Patescibacteria group bacterium]|nr:hypothetical protein [Patescibacteria group bacterium]
MPEVTLFKVGDKVVWAPAGPNDERFVEHQIDRYGEGPFTVSEVEAVLYYGLANHPQRLRVEEIPENEDLPGSHQFSGIWFLPAG